MISDMNQGISTESVYGVDITPESRSMRRCFLLHMQLNSETALYFSEIEGSINLTVDMEAAQQFETKDDAETYIGLLHDMHPKLHKLIRKLKVFPHGFN